MDGNQGRVDPRDIVHVFERLRSGTVPERGLSLIADGLDDARAEIRRVLTMAADGEGVFKVLRGDYGCGKTFCARVAVEDALEANFVTTWVTVGEDMRLHRFDEVYRAIVGGLRTPICEREALRFLVGRWYAGIEKVVMDSGIDPESRRFMKAVEARAAVELSAMTHNSAPAEMAAVICRYIAIQRYDPTEANLLLDWLAGSKNLAWPIVRRAGIKGRIEGDSALDYLRGLLTLVTHTDYSGLLIVVDEVETVSRLRKEYRGKSLNGMRQLIDGAAEFPGVAWLWTATPDFLDGLDGVAGLPPLRDRISFITDGYSASVTQPQLELRPWDLGRMIRVGRQLLGIYPGGADLGLAGLVDDATFGRLAELAIGDDDSEEAVPRRFLRLAVDTLDKAAAEARRG